MIIPGLLGPLWHPRSPVTLSITWDPSLINTVDGWITRSEADTRATFVDIGGGTASGVAWSEQRVSTGKRYAEVQVGGFSGFAQNLLDNISVGINDNITPTQHFIQLQMDGETFSGANYASHGNLTAGDIVMFAVDMATGNAWVGVNGAWLSAGDPATGANPFETGFTVSGTSYNGYPNGAHIELAASGSVIGFTGKLVQQAAFQWMPSGFTAWANA